MRWQTHRFWKGRAILLSIVLSACGGSGGSDADHNPEPAEITSTISATDVTSIEGDSGEIIAVIAVEISPYKQASVSFTSQDGTAKSGEGDYLSTEGTLDFTGGSTTAEIELVVYGDSRPESDETLTISFSEPMNADLGTSSAVVTILNDDPPRLNDTGVYTAGEFPVGNNICEAVTTINAPQDCNQGRDADTEETTAFDIDRLDQNGSVVNTIEDTACFRDNVTGLYWEEKPFDAESDDVRHVNYEFRWGGIGADQYGSEFYADWNALLDAVNGVNLCGYSDWRVPNPEELRSIGGYSDIVKNPRTKWTTSTSSVDESRAVRCLGLVCLLNFSRDNFQYVTLVRGP